MNKWILFAGLFIATWLFLAPLFGITGGWLHALILTVAIALTLSLFNLISLFPFKLKQSWAMISVVVLWGFLAFTYGWLAMFGNILPTGAVTIPGVAAITLTDCRAGISPEILGTSSTLDVNAWNQESNTPYSSAVDLTTNCNIYKNGNAATNYVGPSSDTSAYALSGFAVGDSIFVYCGGASYYTDPVEGTCVLSQRQPLELKTHAAIAESEAQITVYDNTGGTALDAASSTNFGDYNLSLGAGADESIYVKLKVNAANNQYSFCGWGVTTFYNISKVSPQNVEAIYTAVATPEHMKSIAVEVNSTTSTLTKDYTVYKANKVIVLHQWDSIKEEFVVEADDTNDPVARDDGDSTKLNGFAILAKDCQYSRGTDGIDVIDFYQHDVSQSDIGVAETETSPRGKQTGVQIVAR